MRVRLARLTGDVGMMSSDIPLADAIHAAGSPHRRCGYVTDALVERAAKAMADDWNPERDPILTAMFRDYALSALEAVAPLVAAKAWEEGYQACRNRPRVDGYLINRANPYQSSDVIERGES